jgi:hypothetical protein
VAWSRDSDGVPGAQGLQDLRVKSVMMPRLFEFVVGFVQVFHQVVHLIRFQFDIGHVLAIVDLVGQSLKTLDHVILSRMHTVVVTRRAIGVVQFFAAGNVTRQGRGLGGNRKDGGNRK